jgi:hypothetical protein
LARKITVLGALAAFVALGVTIGFVTQRGSGRGSAANDSGQEGRDVRYLEVTEELYGPADEVESTTRLSVWLSADGSKVRWETGGPEGAIQVTTLLDGDSVKELKHQSDIDSYSELRVIPPYDEPVRRSRRPAFLVARDMMPPGELHEVAREVRDGRTVVTARAERPPEADADADAEGNPPVTAYEVVYEEEFGFAFEMRFYTTAADGSEELLGGRRFRYEVDTHMAEGGIFNIEPPPGAQIYRDVQWTVSSVKQFSAFAIYHMGPAFEGSALTVAQESQQQNTPTGERHLLNFFYQDAGLTVTNQPATGLAGVPRCESPEPVVSGSLGDVVLEGNRACGYGTEIATPLGPAVLRSDSPTVEIQLGQTVVFVHARSEDAAVEAARNLQAAN